MSRPEFLSEQAYRWLRLRAERTAEQPGALRVSGPATLRETLVEVCAAGFWLGDEFDKRGAEPKERDQIVFAFGQACLGREPWATAQRFLELWQEGRAPAPGPELAERLLSGDVSDLPPGGVRVHGGAVAGDIDPAGGGAR